MARSRFAVVLTIDAERDLEEIVEFVETRDSVESADHVFEGIAGTIRRLDVSPRRGRVVPELREVGVSDYREVRWKPYRILYYFPSERVVSIVAVFDGRRDLEELLARRLLR